MSKKIVVPVDFSPQNEKLVSYAVEFAKLIHATVTLVHVSPMDTAFAIGDLGYQYIPEVENTILEDDATLLDEYTKKVEDMGVSCERQLLQGIAKDAILDYISKHHTDFLVIGSHGRSGFYDVFVGSLTKELTQKSPIPVVVVPVHD